MKFLVLALCVCAASAASFPSTFETGEAYKGYNRFQPARAAPVAPVAVAAKAFAPAVAPVVNTFAAAAAETYNDGATAYQGAKQVVNKAYSNDADAQIVRSESEVAADGFNYIYETNNGINSEATGVYKKFGEAGALVVKGGYRYTAPDGTPVVVTYIADENGYQPKSDSLPVGPAIPEAILRSIAYNAANSKKTAVDY